MLKKLYENIIEIIKKNYGFIIGLSVGFLLFTVPIPYYINAPGGVSDISSKINIDGREVKKDIFNLAYIYEYKATIPFFIYAYFNKNWDIVEIEDVKFDNETINESLLRSKILLNEANQIASIVAYEKANKDIKIENSQVFITYIDVLADTDLKIGDEIIAVDGQKINDLSQLKQIIQGLKVGDKLVIQVKRNKKTIDTKSLIIEYKGEKMIGILISLNYELKLDPNIKFNFGNNESGSSGGLMMSLSIYDTLVNKSIKNNWKIAGTGTININGEVGDIGGVKYKVLSAEKAKMDIFLVPNGENYEEAEKLKNDRNLKIKIIPINHIDDAINYLYN